MSGDRGVARRRAPAITITTGDSGRVCRGSGARRSRATSRSSTGACFLRLRRPIPSAFPGFVGALGPDGPIGYSTDVRITETNDDKGQPHTIAVRARSSSLYARSAVRRRIDGDVAHAGRAGEWRQLPSDARPVHRVRAGGRRARSRSPHPASAETFRGRGSRLGSGGLASRPGCLLPTASTVPPSA